MRAVILAGGMGMRMREETDVRPKPMIEIGGRPILWHILKLYSSFGIDDFVICLGYKGYVIKEYFANYYLHMCDVAFDISNNRMEVLQSSAEPWKVTLVNTGDETMTGGRIKRALSYVGEEDFCLTYGDGISDIDLGALIHFHRSEGRLATVTAVQPPGRFGAMQVESGRVRAFQEKPSGDGGWINGGFFVVSPQVGNYIEGDDTIWERDPLQRLAAEDQLASFEHSGFWHPMDTMRDKNYLEELWATGRAPWKVWE